MAESRPDRKRDVDEKHECEVSRRDSVVDAQASNIRRLLASSKNYQCQNSCLCLISTRRLARSGWPKETSKKSNKLNRTVSPSIDDGKRCSVRGIIIAVGSLDARTTSMNVLSSVRALVHNDSSISSCHFA